MITRSITALLLSALMSSSAYALEAPLGGQFDKRIRFIDYNAAEVVKLVGHYGFSTHIQFNTNEAIKQIAMGDPQAWDVGTVGNHIFIKPVGDKAITNMTVVTNSRVYNFDLSAHWSKSKSRSNDMYFQINFKYPNEEANAALIQSKKIAAKNAIETNLQTDVTPENWNYWAKGSEVIAPDKAFDDNRFTYLSFNNNKEMPAIYVVNDNNTESLINTNIDPAHKDTIIIHTIAKKLILRKGSYVTEIYNKSYNPQGISNETGTVSANVERVIKGK
jgi:type IV secretion system protein VirB9